MSENNVAALCFFILLGIALFWLWKELRTYKPLRLSPLQRGQEWKKTGYWTAAIKEFSQVIQADPKCIEAYIGRAECYLNYNRLDAALADLNQALTLNPQAHYAYFHRAAVYISRNDYEAAFADYNQAFLISFQNVCWWLLSDARFDYSPNNLLRVIADCETALAANYKASEKLYLSRGWAKLGLYDFDGSLHDFNAVLGLNPSNTDALLFRATIDTEKKDYKKAVESYTEILNLTPNIAVAHFQRGMAYYYLKDYEKALLDFDTALMLDTNHNANIYFWRGTTYGYLGNLDKTIADYETAFVSEPILTSNQKLNLYLNYGITKYKLDDNNGAIASLNKALEIDPNLANAYFWRGQAYQYQHNWDPAIADYTQAINLKFEKISRAYFGRGYCYLRKRDLAAALADYNEVIRLNPDQLGAYNNRACVYAARGDLELALADCNQILNLDSSVWFGYENRGYVYFLMGRYDDALADFQKALAIKTDHPFMVAGEAVVLHALGRMDEAKAKWHALVQLDAKYQDADALQDEYNCAEAFVAEARKVAALAAEEKPADE